MREHVEERSGWEYSGEADLVLIGCYLLEQGEPMVDWDLTLSGSVTDTATGTKTLNLGAVIEKISRDLANAVEDPDWGVLGSSVRTSLREWSRAWNERHLLTPSRESRLRSP